MNHKLMLLASTIALLLPLSGAGAEPTFRGRPNCPEYDSTHNWKDYFAGKYGEITHPVSVRFNGLKAPLGMFKPNTCYTVVYEQGVWYTSDHDGPRPASGADPEKLQMNLAGRIMTFNNFGQVIDKELGVVGTLKCSLGPDC